MNPFIFDYPQLAKYIAHKKAHIPSLLSILSICSALQGSKGNAFLAIDTVAGIIKYSTFTKGSTIENQQSVTTAGNNRQSKNSE